MIKDAGLWNRLPGGKVECVACARRCKIPEGSNGFCFVRKNIGGKLKLANYGIISAMQIDPIEKKPFNHFMPGSYVFGIGTSSCNWGCLFCQNHNISKDREIAGRFMSPDEVVELAVKNETQSIAYTYNEPTIFVEYALDVAELAHRRGLYNLFVTNGYMTKETISLMKGKIDAAVVNFKGNGDTKFSNKYEAVLSNEPVKEAILEMRRVGIHVEMTDLIIPKVGESLEACDSLTKWVADEAGADLPIQFTAFHPDYKMMDHPHTGYGILKEHYEIAKKNGLDYVYIGNSPGNPYESTYCPGCNAVAIGRYGHYLTKWNLDRLSCCKGCGYKINVVGEPPSRIVHRNIEALY